MAVYGYISANAHAVGTGSNVIYTVTAPVTSLVIIGLTITNILSDPVQATIIVNNGATNINRQFQEYINPGATMNPLASEVWILPVTYVLILTAGVAASLDIMVDGITVT